MARHAELTLATGMAVYFCDPHSPWQRGTNENTNGLIRDFFSKETDFATVSAQKRSFVQQALNERPRKILGCPPKKRLQSINLPSPAWGASKLILPSYTPSRRGFATARAVRNKAAFARRADW
ncbi:MAG: IS30 family transposase [Hymenobacteraceae bacterium]|nr:IS30 family transposase [Hymenobacteraceae bacterium]